MYAEAVRRHRRYRHTTGREIGAVFLCILHEFAGSKEET